MEATKWEYNVLYVKAEHWNSTGLPSDINDILDKLGEQHWELVRAEPILRSGFFGNGSRTSAILLFFKRPKS